MAFAGIYWGGNTLVQDVPVITADDGLSLDGTTAKLGNAIGAPGQPAQLLDSRELRMPSGFILLFTDGNGNQTALAPGAFDIIGATAMETQLRPGLVRVIADITSPGLPEVLWLFSGTSAFSALADLDISNGFSDWRLYRINPTQGFNFDVDNVRLGVGLAVPTARIHVEAGVNTPSGAPFKYTAGVLAQTIVEDGAKNFDGSNESIAAGGVTYTLAKTLTATGVLNFPSTATLTSSDLTIALVGAALGDVVLLGVPNASANANSCYTAFVSAADTVTVRFNNYSALPIDPASGTFRVAIVKY